MFPQTDINQITHVITLAIAPVFLLTAVGTLMGVLANRLARIVDRIRVLEDKLHEISLAELMPARAELDNLRQRLRLIYFAVACAVFCALFVGLLIIVAFIDAFMSVCGNMGLLLCWMANDSLRTCTQTLNRFPIGL